MAINSHSINNRAINSSGDDNHTSIGIPKSFIGSYLYGESLLNRVLCTKNTNASKTFISRANFSIKTSEIGMQSALNAYLTATSKCIIHTSHIEVVHNPVFVKHLKSRAELNTGNNVNVIKQAKNIKCIGSSKWIILLPYYQVKFNTRSKSILTVTSSLAINSVYSTLSNKPKNTIKLGVIKYPYVNLVPKSQFKPLVTKVLKAPIAFKSNNSVELYVTKTTYSFSKNKGKNQFNIDNPVIYRMGYGLCQSNAGIHVIPTQFHNNGEIKFKGYFRLTKIKPFSYKYGCITANGYVNSVIRGTRYQHPIPCVFTGSSTLINNPLCTNRIRSVDVNSVYKSMMTNCFALKNIDTLNESIYVMYANRNEWG